MRGAWLGVGRLNIGLVIGSVYACYGRFLDTHAYYGAVPQALQHPVRFRGSDLINWGYLFAVP